MDLIALLTQPLFVFVKRVLTETRLISNISGLQSWSIWDIGVCLFCFFLNTHTPLEGKDPEKKKHTRGFVSWALCWKPNKSFELSLFFVLLRSSALFGGGTSMRVPREKRDERLCVFDGWRGRVVDQWGPGQVDEYSSPLWPVRPDGWRTYLPVHQTGHAHVQQKQTQNP